MLADAEATRAVDVFGVQHGETLRVSGSTADLCVV
jgi:hypothetical protein